MDSRTLEILLKARDDASKVLGNASKNADKSFGSIGGSIKKLAVAAGGIYAVKQVGDFFMGTVDAASDLNETLSKSDVVFGKYSKDIIAMGDKAAESMGLSKEAAIGAAATYGNLMVSLKLPQKESAKMSESLVQLAGDLASFNNVDPTVALDALRSGLVGETEPLKKFGVNMNEATLKEKALAMGLVKSTKEVLPAAVKAQAAYALIMEQTATAQGDYARTSDGVANSQRTIAAMWQDMRAEVGASIAPVFQQLLGFAKDILPTVGKALTAMGGVFGKVLGKVADLFEEVWPFLESIIEEFTDWLSGDGAGIISTVFEMIGSGLKVVQSIFKAVWPAVKSVVKVFADWFNSPAFKGMMKAVMDLIINAVAAFKRIWDAVWPAIGPVLQAALKIITPIITTIVRIISGIITVVSKVIEWFVSLPGKIKDALVGAITWLYNIGKDILQGLKDGIHFIWDKAWEWLGNIGGWIKDRFKDAGTWLWDAGKAILEGLWGGIKWMGRKLADAGGWLYDHTIGYFVKKAEIKSPSRVMFRAGEMVARGLASGIYDSADLVTRAMGTVGDAVAKARITAPTVGMAFAGAGSFVPSTASKSSSYQAGVRAGSQRFAAEVPIVLQLDGKVLSRTLGTVVVSEKRTGAA